MPSLTVTVIVAVPLALATGVTDTVRFAPRAAEHDAAVGHHALVRRGAGHRQAAHGRLRIAHREGDRARGGVLHRAAVGDVGDRRRACWARRRRA